MALVLCALQAFGCAHYQVNAPIANTDPSVGYRPRNVSSPDNSDSLQLFLAFSGGGTRAAALAYGVLEELAGTEVTWEGRRRRLLDEVDHISSVSGGSFTAAYYALRGDGIFDDFGERFLERNVQGALLRRLLSPRNWFRLASPHFGRSDLVAELYDRNLFDGATYADLIARRRSPFVSINATDISLGATFQFTQGQFDLLCSDLSTVSLGRAVAASSAFPMLLSPVTLDSYAGTCGDNGPVDMPPGPLRDRAALRAWELRAYRDWERHPYLHLLDGGLTDNLGLRGTMEYSYAKGGIRQAIAENFDPDVVRKVVVIVVDASARRDRGLDRSRRGPGLVRVGVALGDVPIQRYSHETLELLRDLMRRWEAEWKASDAALPLAGGPRPPVRFHLIEVRLDDLPPEERMDLAAVPTRFRLPPGASTRLRAAAGRLLQQSPAFHELLRELAEPSRP